MTDERAYPKSSPASEPPFVHEWESPRDSGKWGWAGTAATTIIESSIAVQAFVKRHPYMAFGVAGALGVGLGAGSVVGSRVLRMALFATASLLAVELARGRTKPAAPVTVSPKSNGNSAVAATAMPE